MDENKLLFSNRDLRKLIFPLIADQFLQSFVGMADSVMASSAGEAAVSGVSLVDTVMFQYFYCCSYRWCGGCRSVSG